VKRLTKKLLIVLRIAFGVGLLCYVVSKMGGWSTAKQFVAIVWLLPGMAVLTLLGASIESMRLGLLFKPQGIRLSFTEGFRLVSIGAFFNFCIPGGTGGDVMKLYYLASENRKQVVEVATVVLVDRAVALFALLLLVVGLALLDGRLIRNFPPVRWLITASVVGMIGLIGLAVISFSTRVRASRLYRYVTLNLALHRYLVRAFDVLYAFRCCKTAILAAGGVSLLGHMALASMFLAAGRVFFPDSNGLVISVLALLGMLANVLPITPGGLGVGEVAFDHLFGMIGLVGGASLLLAWRVGTLPICFVGCILYMAGVQKRNHLPAPESVEKPSGLSRSPAKTGEKTLHLGDQVP
jgi:uncharacterized protein (TIRG00374 family)